MSLMKGEAQAHGHMCATLNHLSHVRQFVTLWIVACQAPLSMGFSRQEDERVAISFSRGSSQPRDQTSIS